MWLINCNHQDLHLEEFVKDVPPYAILSHTWDREEVTFNDMNSIEKAKSKEGFKKIEATCRVALEHNLDYAWVDTCCIDKSSSAELSEAINSMFSWYKGAAICLVWLCDFTSFPNEMLADIIKSFNAREALEAQEEKYYKDPPPLSGAEIDLRNTVRKGLGNCKWFSRGWTLQELIASKQIDFYDKDWNCFGSKDQLASVLAWITSVDTGVLKGKSLDGILVGRRMSWAANRTTTRVEDIAYCLLGIFDINMPLLYGEGKKAFIRLQEEIIRSSHDLSIFAWKADLSDTRRFRGLMANSPSEFKGCQKLVKPTFEWNNGGEYGLTSRGLRTEGMVRIGRGETSEYGPGLFARRRPWPMATVFDLNVYSAAKLDQPQYIICKESPFLENTVLISRVNAIQIGFSADIFDLDSVTAFPQADWDLRNSILLSFQRPYFWGMWKANIKGKDDGISVVCVRSTGWLLYGVFARDKLPPALHRDDLLPSHVEDILQQLPDRMSTECLGYIHTVKDMNVDLGELDDEVPATLLEVSSAPTQRLKKRRSGYQRVQNLFRKTKTL
ncbi:hypothetical protein M426DRAFT_123183 [Hypoxylon sp. CI-4A]|nr:hypothetical protein M426DRAFT_123183 [Hypoxylon sp. CI-4A]